MKALVIADMPGIAAARKTPEKRVSRNDVDRFVRWFEAYKAKENRDDATDWLYDAKGKLAGRRRGVTSGEEWLYDRINSAAYKIFVALDDAFQDLFLKGKDKNEKLRLYTRFHRIVLRPIEDARDKLTSLLKHSNRFESDDDMFKPADFLVKGTDGKSIFDTYLDQGHDGMCALLQGYLYASPKKFTELYSIIDDGARAKLKEFANVEIKSEYLYNHRRNLIKLCEERLASKQN